MFLFFGNVYSYIYHFMLELLVTHWHRLRSNIIAAYEHTSAKEKSVINHHYFLKCHKVYCKC